VHPGVRRQRIFVSARTGQGMDRLRQAIATVVTARLNATPLAPSATLPDGSLVTLRLQSHRPETMPEADPHTSTEIVAADPAAVP
jgi:GTPase